MVHPILHRAARAVLAATVLAAVAVAAAQAPVFDRVAAVSEGARVSLRWSLPDGVYPPGGFVVEREGPSGPAAPIAVAAPLDRAAAAVLGVEGDAYDAVATVFDPAFVPADPTQADSVALLRAFASLELAVDPDLARVAGVLVDDLDVALGERWRYVVRTASGLLVGSAEITVGSTGALVAPTGLSATPTAAGVALVWDRPSEADLVVAYRVERRRETGGVAALSDGWSPLPTEDAGAPYFQLDEGLVPGEAATYVVVGRDLFGRATPPSAPVTAIALDPVGLPRALVVDAATGDRTIELRWALEDDPRVVALGVLRAATLDGTPELASPLLAPDARSWTDVGLRGGVDYHYAVAAFDAQGAASVGPVWTQRAVNPNPPGAPTGLRLVPAEAGLELAWTAPTEPDVGRYQVYAGRPGAPFEGMALVGETREPRFTAPVPANTLFDVAVRVRAVNTSDVAGPPSEEVVGRPVDATAPSAPLWADVVAGERSVALSWIRDLDPDVVVVRLWRAEGDGPWALRAGDLAPERTTFLDADVAAGATYRYALEAIDASGNASGRGEARAATPWDLDAPLAPTGLVARLLEEGGVALAWDAADAAGWLVWRRAGDAWVELAGPLPEPAFVDPRGGSGDAYRVAAVSAAARVGAPAEVAVPE